MLGRRGILNEGVPNYCPRSLTMPSMCREEVMEEDTHMRRLLVLTLAIGLMLSLASLAGAADSADVYREDGKSLPSWAEANLTRVDDGVQVVLSTSVKGELFDPAVGLLGKKWKVGDATTMWIVTFNDPGECENDGCGGDDVDAVFDTGNNDAGIGIHYGTGSVATSDRWNAAAYIVEDDTDRLGFFAEEGFVALDDADTAEVHAVVRSHGPARNLDADQLADALTSFGGACDVNTCGDPQFTVFPLPAP